MGACGRGTREHKDTASERVHCELRQRHMYRVLGSRVGLGVMAHTRAGGWPEREGMYEGGRTNTSLGGVKHIDRPGRVLINSFVHKCVLYSSSYGRYTLDNISSRRACIDSIGPHTLNSLSIPILAVVVGPCMLNSLSIPILAAVVVVVILT